MSIIHSEHYLLNTSCNASRGVCYTRAIYKKNQMCLPLGTLDRKTEFVFSHTKTRLKQDPKIKSN